MTWDVHIFRLKNAYFDVTFNQVAVHNSQECLQNTPSTIQTLGKQFNMNYVRTIFKTEFN